MTSVKAMLTLKAGLLSVVIVALLSGCAYMRRGEDPGAPYAARQVWAVAPLLNESGTTRVDTARIADHLTQQLENVRGIDAVAVNRVLAAMESLEMRGVTSTSQARALRQALGVDGIVVGTVTAYDPYDPPKLGLSIELYLGERGPTAPSVDVRGLTRAATDQTQQPQPIDPDKPASVISAYFDAADPAVHERLIDYAEDRGNATGDAEQWQRYRISMDLYTEFVSHVVSERLLKAERQRLYRVPPTGQRVNDPAP